MFLKNGRLQIARSARKYKPNSNSAQSYKDGEMNYVYIIGENILCSCPSNAAFNTQRIAEIHDMRIATNKYK